MKRTIFGSKDFLAGMVYIATGTLFVFGARQYDRPEFLDPSTFPTIVGALLALVGLLVASRSLAAGAEEAEFTAVRPLLSVIGSVVVFAILLEPMGVFVAIAGALLLCLFAGSGLRIREVFVVYVAMTALAAGIFVYGLGLALPLFW